MTKLSIIALANRAKKTKNSGNLDPMNDAIKEAWEAIREDDFDGFSDAFRSAIAIKLADDDHTQERE